MYKLLTIGADPEVFLFDNNTNKFVSAVGLIGGSKKEPLEIVGENNNIYNILEDNVMVEYNIPYSDNVDKFIYHNEFMLNVIKTIIPDNLSIKIEPHAEFDWDELSSDQAMQFGCEPSLDAWTKSEFYLDLDPTISNIRGAGGHIHIGYSLPNKQKNIHLVRALDNILGVFSINYMPSERNNNYGKFGNYREKRYGLEYRTPSNWWLRSKENMHILFELINMSFEFAQNNSKINSIVTNYKEIIDQLHTKGFKVENTITI